MAKKIYHIPIEQLDEDIFAISKNNHLLFLIQSCSAIHENIIINSKREEPIYGERFVTNENFFNLIKNLLNENEESIISLNQLKSLKEWIDVIVIITIQLDSADLKDKNMKQFIKIAENFIAEINKFIPQLTKSEK